MRLVAGLAGLTGGVVAADHLGESGRLGDVGFVAAGTEHRGVRQFRNDRGRVVYVFLQRAMTGFAVYAGVLARFLDLDDLRVAVFAGLVTSVGKGPGSGLCQGIAAVGPISSKAPGNQPRTQDQEQRYACAKDGGQPE